MAGGPVRVPGHRPRKTKRPTQVQQKGEEEGRRKMKDRMDKINNKKEKICTANEKRTIKETEFYQLNFKKSLNASIEFNKTVMKKERFICMATEPYIAFEKVGNLGKDMKVFAIGIKPRAAIIYDKRVKFTSIEKLSSRDCAVGFIEVDRKLIIIASGYCDIKKEK